MAWTSPATAVAGTVATAAFWNTNSRDNLNHLYGSIATFSPTLTQSGSVTLTTATGRYRYVGNTCFLHIYLDPSGTGTGANDMVIGNIPAAIAPRGSGNPWTAADVDTGTGMYNDSGSFGYAVFPYFATSSTIKMVRSAGSATGAFFGNDPNIAVAAADQLVLTMTYETSVASS